jgi:hypothetical protein
MSNPVSTVTKQIKIYSDNPIHVAIAAILDAYEAVELEAGDPYDLAVKLHQTVDDLADLAFTRRIEKLIDSRM